MSQPVVDASATLSWVLDDEFDPRAEAAFDFVSRDGGVVPQHWHYEVRNGLLMAVRRERISPDHAGSRLESLRRFRWTTDSAADLSVTWRLALDHNLTFYDALYLELALRQRLPLATLDGELEAAARREDVDVLSG